MPKLATVAIIGRPNTGKSTLFNRMIGERKAIVSEIPGTTRDHVSHRIDVPEMSFLLVDTGGIGSTRDKDFEKDVASQSLVALEHADLILFTINSQEELTSDDRKVLEMMRKFRRRHVPVIVVLTKADTPGAEDEVVLNYQEMNIGEKMIPVSAPHRLGIDELTEAITKELGKLHFGPIDKWERKLEESEKEDDAKEEELTNEISGSIPRIAIIGKPNVGKSSIVNALMSEDQRERSTLLVSPIAGTTRDATDTEVMYHEKPYILVDTAGLKKHARSLDEIERYAMMRTVTAVEGSDIVILVLDASEPISQQDKKIASLAIESGKGLIILLNKIDTMKGKKRTEVIEYATAMLHFCSKFSKIVPCSAVTREGLVKLFDMVEAVQRSRTRRISTGRLHKWFEQTVHGRPLGEITRVKHLTQTKDIPPTFVLFVKNPKRVSVTQLRYLENRMRETFGFDGTPIRWITRETEKKDS